MAVNRYRKRPVVRRRRKVMPSKAMVRRPISYKQKAVHNFTRWNDSNYRSAITLNSDTVGFGKDFSLSDIAGYADFTNLYEQYRICMVAAYVHLQTNPDSATLLNNTLTASGANFYPKVWYVSDKDDANAPASLGEIKEKFGVKCKVLRPNSPLKIKFKPCVAMSTYGTAITTGYRPAYNQWIDEANPNVKHYGLRMVFDCEGISPVSPYVIKIDYKYYIQCKFPK